MKIALTGGTGFIGSHFLKQALASGHSVRALRRSPSSKPRISIDQQPQWLDRQLDEVTAAELQGCDVLVHLAAHTGNVPYDSLANCLRWNLMAVLALFEQARQAGINSFVVAGSCFEYGRSGERYSEIPSDAPLEPTNSYAASKAAASIALRQWAEEHKLTLNILRIFHVFGEGEPETRFWPSLRRAALAGEDFPMTRGEQIRLFQPVNDVALELLDQTKKSVTSEVSYVDIKNLKSGTPMTILQFAIQQWSILNASGSLKVGHICYRSNEVMSYLPDRNK
jgi:nucleoside-diphosphate-sugar epimerase